MKIEKDKIYCVQWVSAILWINPQLVINKCRNLEITASNIWTPKRKIYRVKGSDILDYLEINKA